MSKQKRKDIQECPKVFLDTNVLLSAIFWPNGKAHRAVQKALLECTVFTSDYVLLELKRGAGVRFPGESWRIDRFFRLTKFRILVLDTPELPTKEEELVRDSDDRLIVRAAVHEGIDVILSGDLDLREAGFTYPKVLNAHEFLTWNDTGESNSPPKTA